MGNNEMEYRYINPLTDFGFKRIFGDEEIMMSFLNDVIMKDAVIQSLTFLDKEMIPETKYERGIIYDMRCQLTTGEEIIIEMQNKGQDYFTDRINYYMARAISQQGARGDNDWKFELHPVYGVYFINFHLKDKEPRNIRHIVMADEETHELFTDKWQSWLIELPNYRKMQESDCRTKVDYWLYTLTHMETMRTSIPFQSEMPVFHKLENIADMAVLTPEERDFYHISLDSYRTNMACMEHERNLGRAEGVLNTARNLKNLGVDTATIIKATGLSEEEIEQL